MGYEYYYDYPMTEGMGTAMGTAGGLIIVILLIWLLAIAFCITSYVLQSLGMYTIAKRRGIRKPWLAWIPVTNMWILGSISDQYQYVVKGKIRNRRKVLTGLTIALVAGCILLEIGAFIWTFTGGDITGNGTATMGIVFVVLSYLVYVVLAIISAVFQLIALYDLYASSEPDNAVLYLVLSILLNVTLPFFVFACRKKDRGMPARKQPQPAVPEIPEAAAEVAVPAEVPVEEATAEETPAEEAPNGNVPAEEKSDTDIQ